MRLLQYAYVAYTILELLYLISAPVEDTRLHRTTLIAR